LKTAWLARRFNDEETSVVAITLALVLLIAIGAYYSLYSVNTSTAGAISLGLEFNAHATPFYMVLDNALLKMKGVNVTNILLFKTGMELAAGVARGDIAAGQACLGPILVMIDKGVPIRIIGKIHDGGFAVIVNPDRVSSVADLNGQVVYTPGPGSQAYLLALKIQDEYGVKFSEIKTLQPQEILTGLVGGYIDVAILPEPYPEVAESRGLRILLLSSDVWPDMPGSYLFATVDYLEKNRDVLRIIADLVGEMVDEVEEDPFKAAETLSKWLDISGDDALRAIQRIKWNTSLDVDQIQAYIDFAYSKGVIKERYNATLLVESV